MRRGQSQGARPRLEVPGLAPELEVAPEVRVETLRPAPLADCPDFGKRRRMEACRKPRLDVTLDEIARAQSRPFLPTQVAADTIARTSIEERYDGENAGASGRRARTTSNRMAFALAVMCLALLTAGCGSKKHVPKSVPPPTPNRVLYQQAIEALDQRRFEKARKFLTEIGTREAQESDLDPLVKIATADSYYYQPSIENLIESQNRYQQFVSFYPSHPLAGYAQYQVGMCNLKQSAVPELDQTFTRKAIEEFDKVAKIDTTGRWAIPALVMRGRCLQKIAEHDFDVGLFYYKRKAYDGAIARFKSLLESAPEFEKIDGVYYYLGMALLRSKNDEGRLYLEKVQHDYPSSRYASKAKDALRS